MSDEASQPTTNRRKRSGLRETVNLAAQFAEYFQDLEKAGYYTRGLTGSAGIAPRRKLAKQLENAQRLMKSVIALLRSEADTLEKDPDALV